VAGGVENFWVAEGNMLVFQAEYGVNQIRFTPLMTQVSIPQKKLGYFPLNPDFF